MKTRLIEFQQSGKAPNDGKSEDLQPQRLYSFRGLKLKTNRSMQFSF